MQLAEILAIPIDKDKWFYGTFITAKVL